MLAIATLALGLAVPTSILIPQVSPNQVLHFQTRRRITGPFNHTTESNTSIEILPPSTTQPGLRFSIVAVTEGHKATREFIENTETFSLTSSDGPVSEGIAPLGYSAQLFGTPPPTLSVGSRWSANVVNSTFGDRGRVAVTVIALDEHARRCVLDVTFDGSWPSTAKINDQPVSGSVRTHSHGTVTIQDGIITALRVKGEEHQAYPGDTTDSYFDLTKVLVSK
jgi:hypothetical protein